MLSARSDHGGLGDGYMRVFSHLLAYFLLPDVDGESAAGVNGFVECVEVSVNLGLGDFRLVSHVVVIDIADGDPAEALVGVLECVEHPFIERVGPDVDGDETCVDILVPVDVQYLLLGLEAFALVRICISKYVGIHWGCIGGRGGGGGCRSPHFERGKRQVLGSCPSGPLLLPSLVEFQQRLGSFNFFLNQVCIAKYVGSSEILLMTLWGITASTSSRNTFVVAIIAPIRCLTPLVPFGGVIVVQCLSSPVNVVNLIDKVC